MLRGHTATQVELGGRRRHEPGGAVSGYDRDPDDFSGWYGWMFDLDEPIPGLPPSGSPEGLELSEKAMDVLVPDRNRYRSR